MMISAKEAVHIACYAARNNSGNFGKTKLNKALFFAEFGYFLTEGEKLTELKFIKQPHGPAVQKLDDFLSELSDEKTIHQRKDFNESENDLFRLEITCEKKPKTNENTEVFKRISRQVDQVVRNYTANSVSEISHDEVWNFFELGEVIDFDIARAIKLKCTDENTRIWAEQYGTELFY